MSTQPDGVSIGMHQGKVMMRLAQHYGTLAAVIEEVVQNAIDSGATRIDVNLNLTQPRTFSVFDNGSGAGKEKVAKALRSIGDTLKDKDKYGQFGLGLISPIAVARQFTFTSCPTPATANYTAYEFVTKEIVQQHQVIIPQSPLDGLKHNPDGKTWWRTKVEARGITKDRRASRITLGELAGDIALKFGEEIRRRSIQITVQLTDEGGTKSMLVQAPEFSGEQLKLVDFSMPDSGKVKIELFVARLTRSGRKGDIVFGTLDNPSRISARQFVDCASSLLEPLVSKALLSGTFEGRVLCEKVVLNADRTRFDDNDALLALCEVLMLWYKEVGKEVIAEAEEQASGDRFQRIGGTVMPFAALMLRQSSFQAIAQGITIGSVGDGHARIPRKQVLGTDEGKALASNSGRSEGSSGGSGGLSGDVPSKDHPRHIPGVVYGPSGRKRIEVKDSSTGFRFEYVELDDFRIPFTFDPKSGTLSFNIRNPNWGSCQETDVFLEEYHRLVVTRALSLELFKTDGEVSPEILRFAYEDLSHQVFAIKNGKAMSKR